MISNEAKFKSTELLRRLLMLLTAAAIAVLAYFNAALKLVHVYLLSGVIVLSLAVLIYHAVKGFAFFSFEEVGDVLIFKYYSTGNFSFKRMKISISHADFAGYKIERSFYKLRKTLVLYEWLNNRKAAYPPLSISFLPVGQQNKLFAVLQKLMAK
ncbi:MAG: hypothetical protein LBL90_03015 [Prevotellaceae bacterium]|jgi:hypothetical protein|nr:hypothetical protein [Prevotellaceae bacterium]